MTTPADSQISRLAARVSREEPSFLGYRLRLIAERHGWGDDALAAALGCDVAALVHVRLCGMPRDAADVGRVADRFGCDAARLAGVLAEES